MPTARPTVEFPPIIVPRLGVPAQPVPPIAVPRPGAPTQPVPRPTITQPTPAVPVMQPIIIPPIPPVPRGQGGVAVAIPVPSPPRVSPPYTTPPSPRGAPRPVTPPMVEIMPMVEIAARRGLLPLVIRFQELPPGRVLDVSNLTRTGTGARTIDAPQGTRGMKFGLPDIPIISNNYATYVQALREVYGPEAEVLIATRVEELRRQHPWW